MRGLSSLFSRVGQVRLLIFSGYIFLCLSLNGCSIWKSSDVALKPKELPVNPGLIGVRQVWVTSIGDRVASGPHVDSKSNTLTFVSPNGLITLVNANKGLIDFQFKTAENVVAGIGSDGHINAFINDNNEVVVIRQSQAVWRQKLPARSFTPPLVAGNRVFVLTADHSVYAFDAQNGFRLWVRQRQGDALVLRQKGVLFAADNILVTGFAGRLLGLNPDTGGTVWEATLAASRGANDIDRLVQISGQVNRVDQSICAIAFQSAIGCIDLDNAKTVWTDNFEGTEGVAGDDSAIFGLNRKGVMTAWRRSDGVKLWSSDILQFRHLSAPLLLGRSVVTADDAGNVYFVSREDGTLIDRAFTDASGVVGEPIIIGKTLVLATKNGGVYGFRPQ